MVEGQTLFVTVLLTNAGMHLLVSLGFPAKLTLPLLLKLELFIDQSDSLTLFDNQLVLLFLIVALLCVAGSKLLLECLQI